MRGARRKLPLALCRSWLFLNGAEEAVLQAAPECGADVLIQELEDFTPPPLRPKARALAPKVYPAWRAAGAIAGVRVNPLEEGGLDDLAAVMRGVDPVGHISEVELFIRENLH